MDDRFREYHKQFIAGEIGLAVILLAECGKVINRNSIISMIDEMRSNEVNVIHKGLLEDAAEVVRKGK